MIAPHRPRSLATSALLVAAILSALGAASLRADDRDFVRKAVENPYVFFLLDVSGSMNWTPRCTQAQFDAGICPQVCATATGDCYTPMQADSPSSKFYQAKAALHEVISSVSNVQFGFFTYNQDNLGIFHKHWYYQPASTETWDCTKDLCGSTRVQTITWPTAANTTAGEYFGFNWGCTSGSSISCDYNNPADLNNAWETNRARYVPKMGDTGTIPNSVYIRGSSPSNIYRIGYKLDSGSMGASSVTVEINVHYCPTSSCNVDLGTKDVTYRLVNQFLSWEFQPKSPVGTTQEGYFNQGGASDHIASSGTCNGWDSNTDTSNDDYNNSGYSVRYPTASLDPRGQALTNGDVIPADYSDDKKALILSRLSPTPGDFGQAAYFNDHRQGDNFLRLADPDCENSDPDVRANCRRPLIADGSTPLGASMGNFYSWLGNPTSGTGAGWRFRARALDPNWGCRRKYLIALTDGNDTCSSLTSVCNVATQLRVQENFRTYVVAFGVAGGGNALKCLAENGGQPDCEKCRPLLPDPQCVRPGEPGFATCDTTPGCTKCTEGCLRPDEPDYAQCEDGRGDPLYPQNKDELVRALQDIFQSINEESRAFASAAVPSVEANVKDKIFLSDFTPVENASIWAGQLDAYLKPLPFRDDQPGIPEDRPGVKDCTASRTSNCHLWDAATELLDQAPTESEAAPAVSAPAGSVGNLQLGLGTTERRVLHPDANRTLRLLEPPATDFGVASWAELFQDFGFQDTTVNDANKDRAALILRTTLQQKNAIITDRTGDRAITYVMGDVFHSDPLVMESPSDFGDFASDRDITSFTQASVTPPSHQCDAAASSDANYKCYAFRHQYRRKAVLVGTNDGQLHAFDAGVFELATNKFRNGMGGELFSFVPRMAMPVLREATEDNLHIFGVDGPVVGSDVFFVNGDRKWHTVVMVGMREGGRKLGGSMVQQPESGAASSENIRVGFFALDVTQPDPVSVSTDPITTGPRFTPDGADSVPASVLSVPGCASVDGSTPSGCPRPYPTLLWEFTDTSPTTGEPLDEDNSQPGAAAPTVPSAGNGKGDLGAPWSKPILTRILVNAGTLAAPVLETRFVAVIGGGLDPAHKRLAAPDNSNWIYMIDMETGQAIYKRKVEGSVPAVTVVDTDNDNVADVLYAGTTTGLVYKADLKTVHPLLVNVFVKDRSGVSTQPTTVKRIIDPAWTPFKIFQAGNGQPIFAQIQVLLSAKLGRYVLVFGTGDRENLWQLCAPPAVPPDPAPPPCADGGVGRLYVIVDDGFSTTVPSPAPWWASGGRSLPLQESAYQLVSTTTDAAANSNFIENPAGATPGKGWYMLLEADERVITKAFALSGILIFSTFQPDVIPEGSDLDRVCTRTGSSRNFVVFTNTGNAVTSLSGDATSKEKWLEVPDFVTNPFVEQTATQNLTGDENNAPPQAGTGVGADASCSDNERLAGIVSVLKANGPSNAKYANFYLRLGQRLSQQGLFYPACVPIGIMETNWKEN